MRVLDKDFYLIFIKKIESRVNDFYFNDKEIEVEKVKKLF